MVHMTRPVSQLWTEVSYREMPRNRKIIISATLLEQQTPARVVGRVQMKLTQELVLLNNMHLVVSKAGRQDYHHLDLNIMYVAKFLSRNYNSIRDM